VSGTSGASGTSGTSGVTGTSGTSGDTGSTTPIGASGNTGPTTSSTAPTVSTTTASSGATGTSGTTAASGATGTTAPGTLTPSITSIDAQPTTGATLVGGAGGSAKAGGALAPAPSLFSAANPLAGVLPGSVFDPLVNAALSADVPQYYVEHFDVPAFLLPIYESAAAAYDVPWQVLAAINQVETNFGSDLNVSSAGAEGWMQFLPSTWKGYHVDATGSSVADPYNAADAIFAAAKYLAAAGAATNLPAAIFAYNHSEAYVQSVLLRAELLSGVPTGLVNSVSELSEGLFPIQLRYHPSYKSTAGGGGSAGSTSSNNGKAPAPSAIAASVKDTALGHAADSAKVFASAHAAAVAVQDGTIVAIGHNRKLGTYVRLKDSFGNVYTYGNLASVAAYHLLPKPESTAVTGSLATAGELATGPAPTTPASAGQQSPAGIAATAAAEATASQLAGQRGSQPSGSRTDAGLEFASRSGPNALIFAPGALQAAPPSKHVRRQSLQRRLVARYYTSAFGLRRTQLEARAMRVGSHVLAGTILGYLGTGKPHLLFELRPAGAGERAIDPRPFLDAWTQLATLELHRSALGEPLYGPDLTGADAGQALAMSQIDLERVILGNQHLQIALCERRAIAAGDVDRRVLATIEFLVDRGYDPTIAGNCTPTSAAASLTTADSVTVTALDGLAIAGHTSSGSVADSAVRALAALPGADAPSQIASFESVAGAANTVTSTTDPGAIVVSFTPQSNPVAVASTASVAATFKLGPTRWAQLDADLLTIREPRVPTVISTVAIRSSAAAAAKTP
jgi:hypothetical protein